MKKGGLATIATSSNKRSTTPAMGDNDDDHANADDDSHGDIDVGDLDSDGEQDIVVKPEGQQGSGSSEARAKDLLVERLLTEKSEMIVDLFLDMKLSQVSNHGARAEYDDTKLCEYLLESMKKNSGSVSMQSKCCKLIAALTYRNHKGNRTAFEKAGAAEAIIDAMKLYPKDPNLQTRACIALNNLLWQGLKSTQQKVYAKAVGLILTAMQSFPQDTKVQRWTCTCLYRLANQNSTARTQIIKDGGVSAVASAFESHYGKNKEVELAAGNAIKAIMQMK